MGKEKGTEVLKPTSLEELKAYSEGTLIELPPFARGQKLVVRAKRPSLLGLVQNGKIPNPLMGVVNEMFTDGYAKTLQSKDKDVLKRISEVFDLVIEETLIEPTYEEIKSTGLELTDEQKMFLFNFGQWGVQSLAPFLEK